MKAQVWTRSVLGGFGLGPGSGNFLCCMCVSESHSHAVCVYVCPCSSLSAEPNRTRGLHRSSTSVQLRLSLHRRLQLHHHCLHGLRSGGPGRNCTTMMFSWCSPDVLQQAWGLGECICVRQTKFTPIKLLSELKWTRSNFQEIRRN